MKRTAIAVIILTLSLFAYACSSGMTNGDEMMKNDTTMQEDSMTKDGDMMKTDSTMKNDSMSKKDTMMKDDGMTKKDSM